MPIERKFENRLHGTCVSTVLIVLVFVGFLVQIRRCLGGTEHGGFTGVLTRTERLRAQYPVELRLPAGHGTMTLLDSRWQKYDVITHFEIHVIARAYLILLTRNHGGTRVVTPASEKSGYGNHL